MGKYRNRRDPRRGAPTPVQVQPLIGFTAATTSANVMEFTFDTDVVVTGNFAVRLVKDDGTIGPTFVSQVQNANNKIRVTFSSAVNALPFFVYTTLNSPNVRGANGAFVNPAPFYIAIV